MCFFYLVFSFKRDNWKHSGITYIITIRYIHKIYGYIFDHFPLCWLIFFNREIWSSLIMLSSLGKIDCNWTSKWQNIILFPIGKNTVFCYFDIIYCHIPILLNNEDRIRPLVWNLKKKRREKCICKIYCHNLSLFYYVKITWETYLFNPNWHIAMSRVHRRIENTN